MTFSKRWTKHKVLRFCEENFIGEDDSEPAQIAEFMNGRMGSMELTQEETGKEILVIKVFPLE